MRRAQQADMQANDDSRHFGYTAILLASVLLLNACSAPGPSRPPARIEIQEDVGFTITEDAPISGDVRTEYEEALVLLEQGRLDEGISLLEVVADAAPLLTAPRIDLAIAQHRAGNLEDAEKNLLQSLELNPQHPVAHNELGIIYRKIRPVCRCQVELRSRTGSLSRLSLCTAQPGDSL